MFQLSLKKNLNNIDKHAELITDSIIYYTYENKIVVNNFIKANYKVSTMILAKHYKNTILNYAPFIRDISIIILEYLGVNKFMSVCM